MGAIGEGENPGWHFRFVEKYDTDTSTAFIQQLLRYYQGSKIHLVVDNAPWHKRKASRKWLEEIKDLMEVRFLSKYAPSSTLQCPSERRLGNKLLTTGSSALSKISKTVYSGDSTVSREIRHL